MKILGKEMKRPSPIFYAANQCVLWTIISVQAWRVDRNGIIVWIFAVLLLFSIVMLRLEIVERRFRIKAESSTEDSK